MMLIRYKQDHKKIAMGLLSFVPGEEKLKHLQKTMKSYEQDDAWKLFLWKDESITGVVGIQVINESTCQLQHISVNPSYRDQGIGREMIENLSHMLHERGQTLIASEKIQPFFEHCGFTVQSF